MKIAMAQINVEAGKCDTNFHKIVSQVERAKKQGVDIIVFPELCISGSLLGDKWMDHEFCLDVNSYNDKIKNLSDGIGIIFGNLHYHEGKRYNVVFFAYGRNWVKQVNGSNDGMMIKNHYKDEKIFDDARYFFMNENKCSSIFIWQKKGYTYRILLSNNTNISNGDEDFDMVISSVSIPWRNISNDSFYPNVDVPFILVNACGMQNNGKNIVLYDGGSCVFQKRKPVYFLNDCFKEELGIYDFEIKNTRVATKGKLLEALTFAIKEVDRQMFGSSVKWIIGLSGGIDSCINAALLVKALGSDRIVGYNMASMYNSLTTKNNARMLAERLKITIREGSIELLNQATIDTMDMYGYDDTYGSLVYENIQARIRGHLLSTFASIEGGVVINNANKVETALGYCTLYGDAIGAFSPLGDLTKEECFEIARELNDYFQAEIISSTLIPEVIEGKIHWDMPPSAELKDAQLDPMKWFYHDYLVHYLCDFPRKSIETFMQSYLDDSIYDDEIGNWIRYYHLDDPKAFIEDLEWFVRTMEKAVFKRIQSPPILLVSKGAFGNDIRESQLGWITTQHYQELKNKILKKLL